jgi:hypothetical protein
MSAGCFAADDPRFWLMLADPALTPDALEPCDAAFIDGDHSEAGVAADTNIALALVRRGGIVVWHDYDNQGVEVTQVLDGLAARGLAIKHIENSWLAFLRT